MENTIVLNDRLEGARRDEKIVIDSVSERLANSSMNNIRLANMHGHRVYF